MDQRFQFVRRLGDKVFHFTGDPRLLGKSHKGRITL